MRQEEFRMERPGLVKAGDVVKITERANGSLYSYIIEHQWRCQGFSGVLSGSDRKRALSMK